MKACQAKTLGQVCDFVVDCLHKTAPIQELGYPLIRTPNIGRGRLHLDNAYRVSEETYKEWTRRAIPEAGDLILAREAPAGNVAVVKNGEQVCLGQRTVHLRPNTSEVDPDFLAYYLLAPKQQAALLSGQTGATAQHVNMRDIRRLPILGMPDLDVQRKIGGVLAAYDDLIENNRRRIQLVEESARLLYQEWFVHLRFPGHEHVQVVDGVPEGWTRVRLNELVSTQYGYTASATDECVGPKFLRGTDINKTTYINWAGVPYCSAESLDFNKYALSVGDIVVIRMADPGKVAIIEKDIDAIFASYLVRFSMGPGSGVTPYYLFYSLSDDAYQNFIRSSSTGSTRKSASAKLLTTFDLVVPPVSLMREFDEYVSTLRRQINVLLDQNTALTQARDLLLPRLMNGEIAV